MKKVNLGCTSVKVPAVIAGCMRLPDDVAKVQNFIDTAIGLEINYFDHSDIYGDGKCESIMGKALEKMPGTREKIILQSKCGIVPGVMYDFCKEHIIKSVEESLRRLKTDYLDILLLHRPDALVEPEEVAEAFDELHFSGKVRNFGVSNQKPMQIELLKKYVHQPLLINQLQLSITNANMITNGLEVNMNTQGALDRDGSVLDYCRLNDITIQAWSPFQYGFFEGIYLNNDKFPELNSKIDEIADKYGVSNTAIVSSWIISHPANMQIISGTMNEERLREIAKGADIKLTKKEWYEIYMAAGNMLP